MPNTEKTFRPINVLHADGAFYASPERDLGAGILNGMMAAQKFMGETITWVVLSQTLAQGITPSRKRIAVYPADIDMQAEDVINDWVNV